MRSKDALLWVAVRLHGRAVAARAAGTESPLEAAAELLLWHGRALEAPLRQHRAARLRGWATAAAGAAALLRQRVAQVQYAVEAAATAAARAALSAQRQVPTLRECYEDLCQIREEFAGLAVDRCSRGAAEGTGGESVLSATTDPVRLRGVELGPFRLELRIDLAQDRPDVSAFHIVALDPNPAAGEPDVVHPHVRDGQLCAGAGTVPIAAALAEGRLCDAFLAVAAVLNAYNEASPYVRLDQWAGRPCADCGARVADEEAFTCESCGEEYCGECSGACDLCDRGCCRACLEEDAESGRLCCRRCRRRCARCGRVVDAESFLDEASLCPGCHDRTLEEQTTPEEQNHDETIDSQPVPQPAAGDAGGGGERDECAR
jgi:hypothetical protein